MSTSLYDKHLPSHMDIRLLVERYFINSDDYSSDPNNEEGKPIWTVAIMDAIADAANLAAMSKIMAELTRDGVPEDPLSAYLELSRGTYDIEFAEEAVKEVMGREDTREYILSKQPYIAPVPDYAISYAAMQFIVGPNKGYEPLFMCRRTNFREDAHKFFVTGRAFGSDEFHIWVANIYPDPGDDHNLFIDFCTCPESSLYAELHNLFTDIANEPNRNSTNFNASDVFIENEYHRLVEVMEAKIGGIEKTGHFGNLERYFEEYGLGEEDRVRIRRNLADYNAVRAMVLDGRLYWRSGDGREYAATADELHLPCGYFAGESEEAEPWPEWAGNKKGETNEMAKEWNCAKPVPDEVARSVCEDFLRAGGLSNYAPITVIRKSNHPDDDYLYMVIGQKLSGKFGEEDNFAAWTCWNQSTKSLNHGHYGLKSINDAYDVINENHTTEGLAYAERDVSKEFERMRAERESQGVTAAEPQPTRRKGR